MNAARAGLLAALVGAAAGTLTVWAEAEPEDRPTLPVGVTILVGAAVITLVARPPWVGIGAMVAGGLVLARVLGDGGLAQVGGDEGLATSIGRVLQVTGTLVAIVLGAGLALRARMRSPAEEAATDGRHKPHAPVAQVAGLLLLAGIGGELLAAYDDTTGRPARLLFAAVFFSALYGAPALLIRELARRNAWGWPSIVMLAFALGIAEAALIDQSLFSTDYRGIETWNRGLRATFIDPLGLSASNALNFVVGHVIFSFCAPIAIAEAWRPATAHKPWLGRRGTVVAAAAYLLAAGLVLQDPESHSASAMQLAASIAAGALCIGAAIALGRRDRREPRRRRAPRLSLIVAGSFVLVAAATAVPETWIGAVIAATALWVGTVLLARIARSSDWSVRHTAAVATGALLSRGALAFLYYPVIGETSALQKYAHNVTMLAIVCVAAWFALRSGAAPAKGFVPTSRFWLRRVP
jgi:hypothetical protein